MIQRELKKKKRLHVIKIYDAKRNWLPKESDGAHSSGEMTARTPSVYYIYGVAWLEKLNLKLMNTP